TPAGAPSVAVVNDPAATELRSFQASPPAPSPLAAIVPRPRRRSSVKPRPGPPTGGGSEVESRQGLGLPRPSGRGRGVARGLSGRVPGNACRKHITPSEAVAVGRAMEQLEAKAAKRRQREHGGTAPEKVKSDSYANGP